MSKQEMINTINTILNELEEGEVERICEFCCEIYEEYNSQEDYNSEPNVHKMDMHNEQNPA